MVKPSPTVNLLLSDLATTAPLPETGRNVFIEVPDSYVTDERFELAGVEGLAIQRLITLAHNAASLKVVWQAAAARRLLDSPSVHPLAAVALCLNNAEHTLAADAQLPQSAFEHARKKLLGHQLATDMFSDRQALICLDFERPSLPPDLYEPSTRRLRSEADFESLVDDLVYSQHSAGFKAGRLSKLRMVLAVILRELLENTDDHAKTGFDGSVLKPNSIRGLLVKRILETRRLPSRAATDLPPVPCLEFTIFDSGIGYYNSYRRQLLRGQARGDPVVIGDLQADAVRRFELGPDVAVETEYAIVLKCLERHSENAIPDSRPGHRGMGLYEVLRALKMMQGMLEVRTGRIHGYRSFLEGELRVQLEPQTSETRPGMPKASLLDVDRKMLKYPAPRDLVRGSVVRVVVPLA
ncbi:hypothetical protein [Hydrogenophaga sp.]|uniref:hypothetical protein n=1 Tax=Hydrogenophaga sp. TaxID=1904254 RepID=UPI00271EBC0C|nr:hypothetical protein [Hydrogenophaga sp.]MDO9436014.1 hypothetical protein [Hydrogenophaga sp.]